MEPMPPIIFDVGHEEMLIYSMTLPYINRVCGGTATDFCALYQVYLLTIARGYYAWYLDERYYQLAPKLDNSVNITTGGLSFSGFRKSLDKLASRGVINIYDYATYSPVQRDRVAINYNCVTADTDTIMSGYIDAANKIMTQEEKAFQRWKAFINGEFDPLKERTAIQKHFEQHGLRTV